MIVSDPVLYVLLGLLPLVLLIRWKMDPMSSIPAVGPSAPILSYLGAYRFLRNAQDMLQEGYNKHKVFRIPMWDKWVVIVSGSQMNEELRRIPDDVISMHQAGIEMLKARYTIGHEIFDFPIEAMAIRGPLTRNLVTLFPDVLDEIIVAFQDLFPVKGNEWLDIHALPVMTKIIARASNRVFVGLPFCRNDEFIDIVVNFTMDVMKGKFVLGLLPKFLQPLVGGLLPWTPRAKRRTAGFLMEIITQRQKALDEHDMDWPDKPNDYLMWLIEGARKVGQSSELIVQGVLSSNFAAIHTSAMTVTHALYHLAANPEFAQPLRDEIEPILKEEGWSKASLAKMWKLDSFMKESQRFNGISAVSILRKTLKEVTFSDGTRVPPGHLIFAASTATHHDEQCYEDADVFKPFRFSEKRGEEGESVKHQYVTTTDEYITFGHGRHACPGRFFAAIEVKMILAHIVLNYDVRMQNGGGRPPNLTIGTSVLPAPRAKVMFRRLQKTSGD